MRLKWLSRDCNTTVRLHVLFGEVLKKFVLHLARSCLSGRSLSEKMLDRSVTITGTLFEGFFRKTETNELKIKKVFQNVLRILLFGILVYRYIFIRRQYSSSSCPKFFLSNRQQTMSLRCFTVMQVIRKMRHFSKRSNTSAV